ncbi:major facilitator superfamily domain-containing protein [Melanogaster broomeanus]|nr:major facilitator superfamily domain-containing protein [Melanogaster broomeanus]
MESQPPTPQSNQSFSNKPLEPDLNQANLLNGSSSLSLKDAEHEKSPKDLSSVSTALPTIANAFHASQFVWVGSAYAMASTAFLPMSGGLAQSFGDDQLCCYLSLCRAVQGLGGGGIQSLTAIILADLVSLQERGLYAGLFGLTWSLARVDRTSCWRQPSISRTMALAFSLTWGGVTAPWNSATVLAPLIIGLLGLVAFIVYEATLATHPLVPISLLTNWTGISGYLQAFVASVLALCVTYYFPVFFQGCKGASPVMSGVYSLGISALAPAAVVSGLLVKKTGRYRPQIWVGWCILLVGLGLMSTLRANTSPAFAVGFSVIVGVGIGIEYATMMYPILAPLPVAQNAPALAFMWFLRSFAGVWGVTIGSTILQNELVKRLPSDFTSTIPDGGAGLAYALIPDLPLLQPQLLAQVEDAFAGGLMVIWQVLLGIAGLGLLCSLPMKGLPLTNSLDERWRPRQMHPA